MRIKRATNPLLCQLPSFLILHHERKGQNRTDCVEEIYYQGTYLGVTQQLHHPALIRGESSNLPDYRPHKFGFGGLYTFALTRAHGFGNGCCWVASIRAVTEVC
jgi:hypothetical protein